MKKLAFVGLVLALLAVPTSAQQPPAKSFSFTFDLRQLDIVVRALRKMPFEEVVDLLTHMQQQIDAQNKAAEEKK